ncbi:MAG: transglycosylase SLT domain-containing protein [Pseudomonadota bacterium]
MEKRALSIYAFIALIPTLLIGACTHSLKQPVQNEQDSYKTVLATTLQKPDIVVPLLNDSIKKDLKSNLKRNRLIWERIEDGLELTNFYQHSRVVKQKQNYLQKSEYLSIVTKRSEPFIHFVLTEIENRQMPTELAILPIIESGYFPRARSRAKAEGLWQIMPYTGKELGLKRTHSYDGRHDVYAATSAALDYLTQMAKRFDGDWLLALAAYNAGPQRVKRALQSSQHSYDENSYWTLHLPRETREYVPKILALSSIIKDHQNNDALFYPIIDKPYLTNIKLSKRISPAKLIQSARATESEIKLLNPALRNLDIPIHAGYQLLVPIQEIKALSIAINDLPEETQPLWTKHRISRGESLSGIAKRYGTSVFALRNTNNLRNDTIVAGRILLVPTGDKVQLAALRKKQPKRSTADNSTSRSKQTISEPYMYVVALGDSFWKIANRNNTTVERLFQINGRNADQPLQPGESILID